MERELDKTSFLETQINDLKREFTSLAFPKYITFGYVSFVLFAFFGVIFPMTNLDFLLKQHNINHVVIAGMRANTCIDTTSRYAVELGYHTTLIKDGIAAFNWDEIKATVEVNFPSYGHTLLSAEEFVNSALETKNTKPIFFCHSEYSYYI
jgi:nicotinamidase-related amidase